MTVISAGLQRVVQARPALSVTDTVGIVAAILSLLTLTVLVPGALHLP